MAYRPFYQKWQDNEGGGTPLQAAALQNIEDGIGSVTQKVDNLPKSAISGSYKDLKDLPTKADIGLKNVDNTADVDKPVSNATNTVLSNKIDKASAGVVNGIATLNQSGTLPLEQLPVHAQNHAPGKPDDLSTFYTPWTAVGATTGKGVASLQDGVMDVAQLPPSVASADAVALDHGLVAWSIDPANLAGGQGTPDLGQVKLIGVYVRRTAVINKIYWMVGSAGSSPTNNASWAGVYQSDGKLLASANIDNEITLKGLKVETISNTTVKPGMYWVALLFNAGSAPALFSSSCYYGPLLNVNLAVPRFGKNPATNSTQLPSKLDVSKLLTNSDAYWAAIG